MKRYIINRNDSGQRVDKFLTKAVPGMPKSYMYRAIRTKNIKLNRKRCNISDKLEEGDILELYVSDDFFNNSSTGLDFLNMQGQLKIIYEDSNIMILNKEEGLPVHSSKGNEDNLVDRIKKYLYEKGEYIPEEENSFSPSVCNRLDRNTSGIVIAAKNAEALRVINEKIRVREIKKKYICITISRPPEESDTIRAYLKKDTELNKVEIRDKPMEGYKEIVTRYKVLESRNGLSLVEVELITGKTHQIRAHLAHIGCPILGDDKYGVYAINKQYNIFHQALCAYGISFQFKSECMMSYINNMNFTINKYEIYFIKKFIN